MANTAEKTVLARDLQPGDLTARFPQSPVADVKPIGHYEVRITLEDGYAGREHIDEPIAVIAG